MSFSLVIHMRTSYALLSNYKILSAILKVRPLLTPTLTVLKVLKIAGHFH